MSTEAQEAQARSGGWKPKEEFTGDQSRWVEADIFLEKGEKVLPIVQKDRDQLRVKVDKQGKQIEKLLESNKQFGEYTKGQADKLRNENTRLLSELEASQAQAITDGDQITDIVAEGTLVGDTANCQAVRIMFAEGRTITSKAAVGLALYDLVH